MNWNCIILAGGKSIRMGIDKALIHYNGNPLINNLITMAKPFANEIIIVSNNDKHFSQDCIKVNELKDTIGPIGGILEGLKKSSTSWNLVLPVDTIFLDIASLINQLPLDEDALLNIILAHQDQQTQYLGGFYHTNCIERIEEQLNKKEFSLKNLLMHSTNRIARTEGLNFTNLNSEIDLEKIGMMILNIVTFGQISEVLNIDKFNLITSSKNLLELREELINNYPLLKNKTFKIAINQTFESEDFVLVPNSEIALLPPFAGG